MPPIPQKTLRIALIVAISVVAVAVAAGATMLATQGGVKRLTVPKVASEETSISMNSTDAPLTDAEFENLGSLESTESTSTTGTAPIDKSRVYVPNVTQLDYPEAARLIKLAGLEPVEKVVSGKVDKDAGAPNIVYRVTPQWGSHVKRGTRIELRYYTK